MNNQRENKENIDKFRKELKAMFGDIKEIDNRILNKAVNTGLAEVKRLNPVDSGFMRKNWYVSPTKAVDDGIEKELFNIADYSSYVNFGHRLVVKGVTVGWVQGRFMLEKAKDKINKTLEKEFEKEIKKVNRKHDR